jgi:hypothetical protein
MVFHLSGHDRVSNVFSLEVSNQPAKLADSYPFDPRRRLFDLGSRLFFNRCHSNLGPAIARPFEHEKREASVACYESVFHIFWPALSGPAQTTGFFGFFCLRVFASLRET